MRAMRVKILTAIAIVALTAGAAQAQGSRGGQGALETKADKARNKPAYTAEEKKAAEKAYNDALKNIPESKEKPDPWKTMR
jgi:hypothetical protein